VLDASLDMLSGLDPNDVAAIAAAYTAERGDLKQARAIELRHRIEVRRAKSEAMLAELLPARLDDGASIHVISHGDIDAFSYVRHAIAGLGYVDLLALSTWCMGKHDLEQLAEWLNAGIVDACELYLGEIFPAQYGDEYELAQRLAATYGVRLVIARNHSKVSLLANHDAGHYLIVESSANVNTNPRIEQSSLTRSRPLFEFYLEFYRGLRNIDRAAPR
jgi:hypothetical protein